MEVAGSHGPDDPRVAAIRRMHHAVTNRGIDLVDEYQIVELLGAARELLDAFN